MPMENWLVDFPTGKAAMNIKQYACMHSRVCANQAVASSICFYFTHPTFVLPWRPKAAYIVLLFSPTTL